MLAGTIAGNPPVSVLGRGLLVLVVAYVVGRLLEVTAASALAGDRARLTAAAPEADAEGPKTFPLSEAARAPDDAAGSAGARMAA